MSTRRQELLELFSELSQLTALDEGSPQSFRARAYENALQALRNATGDIDSMSLAELTRIDGIGKSTAQKVREFFVEGRIAKLDELRARYPPAYVELSRMNGLGPKTLSVLRSELGVESVADLRQAIAAQKVRSIRGLGEKTEERLARMLDRMQLDEVGVRIPIAQAIPLAERLVATLRELPDVAEVRYCGSLRRMRETVGDLDVLVASTTPAAVVDRFLATPLVRDVLARGEAGASVLIERGIQVDLRVVRPAQMGAATIYFTGSKAHNVKLRQLAIRRGWTLNEYGLSEAETGAPIAAETEEAIYRALGLPWIPAPMREDAGEIERAAENRLPSWVRAADLKGDLHVHTSLSGDGRSPLAEVVAAARRRGLRYLAITDHAEDLNINGVSREALRAQRIELAELARAFPDLHLLQGAELNIGRDGNVDYDDAFRRELDWGVASVHSHFDLDQATQTRRIIRAMEDPTVNAIGHLSGRRIGKRPGIDLDIDAVLDAAVATGTAIEINSSFSRLDASSEVLMRARDRDVKFVINSDSHHVDEFERLDWGARYAQRGWVERDRVVNTWEPERFLEWASSARRA